MWHNRYMFQSVHLFMRTKIQLFFQQVFFQKVLTNLLGYLANSRLSIIKNAFIRLFKHSYAIDMSEALEENPYNYLSFHDFFIRRLKEHARPIDADENSITSPADGVLSQVGVLEQDQLLQAKGKYYSVLQLLAGDQRLAEIFQDGSHALIYLAPHNYHRVHMPMTGRLLEMIYVPGALFSVSPCTALHVDGLFAKNERVIAIFETSVGKMAVILVGAMIVGSIATVWAGKITPPRDRHDVTRFNYNNLDITLEKGAELGYFSLGSTVITLFEQDKIEWINGLSANAIQMGQAIAKIIVNN